MFGLRQLHRAEVAPIRLSENRIAIFMGPGRWIVTSVYWP
jgi:hypothetical protein